jgi:hypothetical protein
MVAVGTSRRRWVRLFVIWLKRNGACGELHVPRPQPANQTIPLADTERIQILRGLLTNTAVDPRDRFAASLLLFYAQPMTRIVKLTTSDVHTEQDQVAIELGKGVLALTTRLPAPILAERFGFHHGRTARGARAAAGTEYADYVALRTKP